MIGPPLIGDNWVAFNGLSSQSLNAHSMTPIPIGGRINGAERFAIDFIRIDPKAPKGTEPIQGSYSGDLSRNTSYHAFDQPLIAVANAKVVTVVSDRPDGTPNSAIQLELPTDQLPGNEIILDLGHGIYALYAHLKQGSAEVKVGETVKKGQEIGRLGNSGSSTEAHLHFQLQAGPLPLTSDNVPWVIDTFTAAGTLGPGGVVKTPTPGPRTAELPVGDSISNFAALSR
ncbi:M23 family metallopeptidase [Rathayibacter soli]|uniref:M23 family metallopeptidase n=1 Tax=Rathayibacter soli TaxID=3144168 RepID=UPI0027E3E91D|nr:M23 family metallopeptidase [Glaciibacter superstes]